MAGRLELSVNTLHFIRIICQFVEITQYSGSEWTNIMNEKLMEDAGEGWD